VADGVCALFIAEQFGVTRPTCGEQLKVLARAGLLRPEKIERWVFHRRDEERISAAQALPGGGW
jgi:ArsR family transcriptional regulator